MYELFDNNKIRIGFVVLAVLIKYSIKLTVNRYKIAHLLKKPSVILSSISIRFYMNARNVAPVIFWHQTCL